MRKLVSSDYSEIAHLDGSQTVKKLKELLNAKTDNEGLVIELNKSILGYVIYEPSKSFIVSHLFVDPIYRRLGYGKKLISNVIDIMLMEGSKSLFMTIDEYNVDAQLFLKALGFVGTINKTNRALIDFKFTIPAEEMALL